MVSNRIQGEIKAFLGRILEGRNEVNPDGRAIKGSQIRVSEENM